ncbi:hypothetical protein ACO0QE_003178 [Hanseniaspora vineae]
MKTFYTTLSLLTTAALGYAVYFDYQRRNNFEFRRSIHKKALDFKKQQEVKEVEAAKQKLLEIQNYVITGLAKDPLPTGAAAGGEDNSAYFQKLVEDGEKLASQPGMAMEAAFSFYKALCIFPNPVNLLSIYQRSVPAPIYETIALMIAAMPPANVATMMPGQDNIE